MLLEIPPEIQMAIRLHGIKADKTTGEVVSEAIERTYPEEMKEAKKALESKYDGQKT
jgi:hypothetical protein